MKILKPDNNAVYDNLYAKPTQLGVPDNHNYSMCVIFSVNNVLYYGNYDFIHGVWITIQDGISNDPIKKSVFNDKFVEFWFYPPSSKDVFDKYREDVVKGNCRDDISRIDEYVENFDTYYKM